MSKHTKLLGVKVGTFSKIIMAMPGYVSEIARKTRLTYSHVVVVLSVMEAAGIVIGHTDGRTHKYNLTPMGEKIKEALKPCSKI